MGSAGHPSRISNRELENAFTAIRQAIRFASSRWITPAENDDLDDVASEVMLRLMEDDCRRLRTYDRSRAGFQTWIEAVVLHHMRKRSRAKTLVSLDDTAISCRPSQDQEVWQREMREIVRRAVKSLTTRERELINHLLGGTPNSEIGRIMGIKVSSVHRRKCLLVAKLRKLVGGDK